MKYNDAIGVTKHGEKIHKGIYSSSNRAHFALCNSNYKIECIILHDTYDKMNTDNIREVSYEFLKRKIPPVMLCRQCFDHAFFSEYKPVFTQLVVMRY